MTDTHHILPGDRRWRTPAVPATVGADPARRSTSNVEGPTPHDRELPFGRGLAAVDRAPTCICRSSRTPVGAGPGRFSPTLARSRAALVTVVLACALVATGCGGGDAAAPADAGATLDATAATGDQTALAGADGTTLDATGAETGAEDPAGPSGGLAGSAAAPGVTVATSRRTPKAFRAAMGIRPIVVVLYQPDAVLDKAALLEARLAARTVDDAVLLTYAASDVAGYGDLPEQLGLFSTPSVAVVSRSGEIQNFWAGYVDRGLLERSVQQAADATASEVTSADAPPISPLANAASLVAAS